MSNPSIKEHIRNMRNENTHSTRYSAKDAWKTHVAREAFIGMCGIALFVAFVTALAVLGG